MVYVKWSIEWPFKRSGDPNKVLFRPPKDGTSRQQLNVVADETDDMGFRFSDQVADSNRRDFERGVLSSVHAFLLAEQRLPFPNEQVP